MKYVKRFIMREIFAIIYYEMLVGVENLAFYLQNKNCCIYNPNRGCCFRCHKHSPLRVRTCESVVVSLYVCTPHTQTHTFQCGGRVNSSPVFRGVGGVAITGVLWGLWNRRRSDVQCGLITQETDWKSKWFTK